MRLAWRVGLWRIELRTLHADAAVIEGESARELCSSRVDSASSQKINACSSELRREGRTNVYKLDKKAPRPTSTLERIDLMKELRQSTLLVQNSAKGSLPLKEKGWDESSSGYSSKLETSLSPAIAGVCGARYSFASSFDHIMPVCVCVCAVCTVRRAM